MLFSFVQPQKIPSEIVVMFWGRMMQLRLVQKENAVFPIFFIDSGNTMPARFAHLQNASSGISSSPVVLLRSRMRLALGVVSLRALRASFILLKNSSGFSTFPVTASEVVPSESSFIFSSMLLAVTETSGTDGFSFAPPVSGLLGFVLELPLEVPGLYVFPPSGFVGFSTGVVACPLSSSEPRQSRPSRK